MKKLIYVLLALPLLISCSQGNRYAESKVKLIETYFQAVENLDYETMASLLDENYKGFGPSYGDSINREQAVVNWKNASESIYESIKYNRSRNASVTILEGENEGDWVSNWAELTIRYQWTDIPVTLWANSIYQIKDVKIIKSYTFYNEADAYRQLGFEFIDVNN